MKQKVTVKVNDSVEIVCNKNENLLRVLEKMVTKLNTSARKHTVEHVELL